MKISGYVKSVLGMIAFIVGAVAMIVLLSYASTSCGIACTECGKKQKNENTLVLRLKFGRKSLEIPYCPKCFVMIMDDPDLTWAGNQ